MAGKQQLGQQSARQTIIAAVVKEILVVTVIAAIVAAGVNGFQDGALTLLTL